MILIGLGSNISTKARNPREILDFTITRWPNYGLVLKKLSSFYLSNPVGPQDQPPFVNAVAEVTFEGDAAALLRQLHLLEEEMGRTRAVRWHARTLDLDLLDFNGEISCSPAQWKAYGEATSVPERLVLPHPRLHQRRFVLEPLAEIAPSWIHPVLNRDVKSLLLEVTDQAVQRI